MKFHQLAARSRDVGNQFINHLQFNNSQTLANPTQASADMLQPIKHQVTTTSGLNQLNLLNLQLQQPAVGQQSQRAIVSDDEDEQEEDFDQQQQRHHAGHQQTTTTSSLYDSLTQAFAEKQQIQQAAANATAQHQRHLLSGGSSHHEPLAVSSQDIDLECDDNETTQEAGGGGGAFLIDKNKKLFPQKLWELIHNPSIQHCLRWSQDGQRVYLNRNEFEQYYLKTANNQFHTQKAISFVRQMNMYGFRKVDDCYYENDNFRRDRKHLLKNMIRRHPNKGLFVGLDHHQLAAAAAAQQALQVNQQLQQLESQHKQRAEQALRLNNYLNQQQQSQLQATYGQYQSCAAGAMNLNTKSAHHLNAHHQHHHLPQLPPHNAAQHSSPFDQMSSQLVAQVAAASQFSQQQQQQQQQQVGENLVTKNSPPASVTAGQAKHSPPPPLHAPQAQHLISHQPKKSRLLSNFYQQEREKELQLQQQLKEQANKHQHLNLSSLNNNNSQQQQQADLQAALNLGSPLGGAHSKLSGARTSQHEQIREAKIAAHQLITSGCCNGSGSLSQQNQAALHETLVRSLLQLKQQQNEHDHRFENDHHHHHQPLTASSLVAALAQQQQQRTLLESLASLSSGGTGSIVDPASNSPTERTATPPSGPPSPRHSPGGNYSSDTSPTMALNLAKSSCSPEFSHQRPHKPLVGSTTKPDGPEGKSEEGEDYAIQVDDDDDDNDCRGRRAGAMDNEMAGSPLDATKKVRKFLEDQMERLAAGGANNDDDDDNDSNDGTGSRGNNARRRSIKREACSSDEGEEEEEEAEVDLRPARSFKKQRETIEDEQQDLNFISKLLVSEICNRRGRGQLMDELALDEAAKYTQCFLDVLIDDASLIAGGTHNTGAKSEGEVSLSPAGCGAKDYGDDDTTTQDKEDLQQADEQARSESNEAQTSGKKSTRRSRTSGAGNGQDEPIDVSSLSLALKLIPSKLIAAVQAVSCGAGKPQRVQSEPSPTPQASAAAAIES